RSQEVYDRKGALDAAKEHAAHFLEARQRQVERLEPILDRPPIIVAPYDAELFGHWWYEGLEFLDSVIRQAGAGNRGLSLVTPGDYLRRHPTNQLVEPAPSSWGEQGYWGVWLDERNHWIYPHLHAAQERMSQLARHFSQPSAIQDRALAQA